MKQFSIVGHSLGGLVARIYAQKYGNEKINKIITVGSPHQGVAQAYKAVEAGEIDRYDNFFWLAQKLILQLNKNGIKTDKQVIEERFPVAKDLLPTYNFLKNNNNEEISVSDMKIKNDFLLSYTPTFPDIFPVLTTIVGETGNTLFGYRLGERTVLDLLLDYYPDGRPIENFSQIGDYLVLSSSAQAGNNNKIFNLGHSELIYKKEPIKEILNSFALPYQENQILEGTGTTISPSLLFLILSPAEMKVEFNNNTYIEKDGLSFIENAESGEYQLKVTGKEKGSYQILIGQIGENNDLWTTINGEITSNPPTSQVDEYNIEFDNSAVYPPLSNSLYFDELIGAFSSLKSLNIKEVNLALDETKQAKKLFQNNSLANLRSKLLTVYSRLAVVEKKAVSQSDKDKVNKLFSLWETVYGKSLKNLSIDVKTSQNIKKLIDNKKIIFNQLVKKIADEKKSGKNITTKLDLSDQINSRLNEIDDCIKSMLSYNCEGKIKNIENFIQKLKTL